MSTFRSLYSDVCIALGVIALFAISGCAGGISGFGGPNVADMSAAQLNALAKNKETGATCFSITAGGITTNGMSLNQDKTVGTGGGKTTLKCPAGEVTFEDAGKAPAAPKP